MLKIIIGFFGRLILSACYLLIGFLIINWIHAILGDRAASIAISCALFSALILGSVYFGYRMGLSSSGGQFSPPPSLPTFTNPQEFANWLKTGKSAGLDDDDPAPIEDSNTASPYQL